MGRYDTPEFWRLTLVGGGVSEHIMVGSENEAKRMQCMIMGMDPDMVVDIGDNSIRAGSISSMRIEKVIPGASS